MTDYNEFNGHAKKEGYKKGKHTGVFKFISLLVKYRIIKRFVFLPS